MVSDAVLRKPEVEKICGIKSSTIYRLMDADKFPKPIPVAPGSRYIGWLSSEIQAWIQANAAARENHAAAA